MASSDRKPLESLTECSDWVLSGRRSPSQFKIGSEYERIAIDAAGLPLNYDGKVSVRTLLERLAQRHGWQPYQESGRPIALLRGGASISLEPAGQFELSGNTFATVAEMRAELQQHLYELRDVAEDLGVHLCSVGLNPLSTLAGVPKMPKGRYDIMRRLLPKVGGHGLHMMHLTCTVQANLDFSSGEEAMEMMRLGHLLSPILIGLFANSPILFGKETGYATYRAHLWTDVDPSHCDVSHFAFDQSATVQDYVNWVIDAPMYVLGMTRDDGGHGFDPLPVPTTFRTFFEQGIGGRRPTLEDWELHASTVFPDVRLKRYIELRQTDIVPPEALPALPALTKGLFYDTTARRAALAALRDGDAHIDRSQLREIACRHALDGYTPRFDLRETAEEILRLAREGLGRLAAVSGSDRDAATALEPLEAICEGDAPPFYERTRQKLAEGKDKGLLALADPW